MNAADTAWHYRGGVPDHYFSATPASDDERRERSIRLGGSDLVVETAAGVFSAGRLDPGTRVLLSAVDAPPPNGVLVDLGCGWGPIALDMALLSPAAEVIAVDVNERARALTDRNAKRAGITNVTAASPEEAERLLAGRGVDLLRSNPPIRIGKQALHALLRVWLSRLTPAGEAQLVVARNLGADSLQRWLVEDLGMVCERRASSKGYRVLSVRRSAGREPTGA